MLRLVALAAVLATTAAAAQAPLEPPPDSLRPAERARLLIDQDEKGAANRIVGRALDDAPDDPELLTLRLQLLQEGVGLFGRPPFARRVVRARAARRLLDADPTNPHAHDELGRQALNEYLFDRDYLSVAAGFSDLGIRRASGAMERQRALGSRAVTFNRGGRYDLARLRDLYPFAGRPGLEDALAETRGHLSQAVESGGAPFAEPFATLLVAERDWSSLLRLADDTGDGLLRGAALYRLGRTAEAARAFRESLADLPEAVQLDLDDPVRIRPEAPPRDAAAFWDAQDPRLLSDANERLLEHRTRVIEADRLFGWDGSTPGRDTPRGQIYVRYGAPQDRATFDQPFYPGEVADQLGTTSPHFEVWEYANGLRYVFSDPTWGGDYAIYAPTALAFGATPDADTDDYIAQDERLKRDLPDLSQYAPGTVLPVELDVVAFRGEGGQTDLVIASSVRVEDPTALGAMRTGAYLVRGTSREATREDSTTTVAPLVSLASGTLWSQAAQLGTAPGEVHVRAEVAESDGNAAGWATQSVQVPAWGPGLRLSGLLLARSLDEGRAPGLGEITRRGTVVQPAPGARFPAGDPVGLYAEVYGLEATTGTAQFAVRADLVPADGRPVIIRAIGGLFGRGTRRGVSVEIEETAPGRTATVALFLDASRQNAGTYTLTLTVTDRATGETTEVSREVTLE
ncbi:MAG: GWxTD domain-containing protein [Bacteroidota bacterium]